MQTPTITDRGQEVERSAPRVVETDDKKLRCAMPTSAPEWQIDSPIKDRSIIERFSRTAKPLMVRSTWRWRTRECPSWGFPQSDEPLDSAIRDRMFVEPYPRAAPSEVEAGLDRLSAAGCLQLPTPDQQQQRVQAPRVLETQAKWRVKAEAETIADLSLDAEMTKVFNALARAGPKGATKVDLWDQNTLDTVNGTIDRLCTAGWMEELTPEQERLQSAPGAKPRVWKLKPEHWESPVPPPVDKTNRECMLPLSHMVWQQTEATRQAFWATCARLAWMAKDKSQADAQELQWWQQLQNSGDRTRLEVSQLLATVEAVVGDRQLSYTETDRLVQRMLETQRHYEDNTAEQLRQQRQQHESKVSALEAELAQLKREKQEREREREKQHQRRRQQQQEDAEEKRARRIKPQRHYDEGEPNPDSHAGWVVYQLVRRQGQWFEDTLENEWRRWSRKFRAAARCRSGEGPCPMDARYYDWHWDDVSFFFFSSGAVQYRPHE